MTLSTPPPIIEQGSIVKIHSLQSAGGQKLNGKIGLALKRVKDDKGDLRWQIRVKGVKPINATSSIKPANLEVQEHVPLPVGGGRPRGYVEDVNHEDTCAILCELLVMHTEFYEPPETRLTGYPAAAFGELGDHFSAFTAIQMEWVGGTYALANTIDKGKNPACEEVVFAMLQAHPMIIDVFILTMTNTPLIGTKEEIADKTHMFHEYRDGRHQMTPDQQTSSYILTMKAGPLFLLQQVGKLDMGVAFFAAMKRSKVFPFLVQRMLRLIGGEGIEAPDGVGLGPQCREILPKLCAGIIPDTITDMFEKGPMTPENGLKLLEHVAEFDEVENFRGAFKSTMGAMSHGATVSKYLSMLNRKK
ncbi:expressed unknown protein [Seminavis robusta]|uniref:Uncharacterized protein n=1 Tax=Seminavis robusta TaxID=568900 RepID=A0A9N8EY99_9STRA|nr:expressed unknown protein [Seminavis robusta]|eukprot:Sro2516_g329930.1 n/a (360) ;mRNA; f:5111-6316